MYLPDTINRLEQELEWIQRTDDETVQYQRVVPLLQRLHNMQDEQQLSMGQEGRLHELETRIRQLYPTIVEEVERQQELFLSRLDELNETLANFRSYIDIYTPEEIHRIGQTVLDSLHSLQRDYAHIVSSREQIMLDRFLQSVDSLLHADFLAPWGQTHLPGWFEPETSPRSPSNSPPFLESPPRQRRRMNDEGVQVEWWNPIPPDTEWLRSSPEGSPQLPRSPLERRQSEQKEECIVCTETGQEFVPCTNPQCQGRTCPTCYRRMVETGGRCRCPYCRSPYLSKYS